MSQMWIRLSEPIWNTVGPRWYSTSIWQSESLSTKQYALLRLLSIAQSERLEIKPLVAALADEQRGFYRRRLRQLARRLNRNVELIDALEKTPDVLSDNAVLALRFGAQSGTLGKTYEHLLMSESPRKTPASACRSHIQGYWIILACAIFFLTSMIMFFIAPTFKKMSDEFAIRPTLTFRLLCLFQDFLSHNVLWIALAIVVISWVVFYSPLRRMVRREIYPRFLRSNAMVLSARLFEMFAVAAESGRPIPGALSTLAKYHFDRTTRQRLLVARNEVEQGLPAWYSLIDAKVITKEEFQAIDGADNGQVQAWALRKIAAVKLQKVQAMAETRAAFLHPAGILVFASIVLWICYAFFSIVTNMINSLA